MGLCGSKADIGTSQGSSGDGIATSKHEANSKENVTIKIKKQTPSTIDADLTALNKTSAENTNTTDTTADMSDILNGNIYGSASPFTESTNTNTNTVSKIKSLASEKDIPKVLLLGAGESGKSTVFQQLRILNDNEFSEQEKLAFKYAIFENLLEIGEDLINARRQFKIELTDQEKTDFSITDEDLDEFLAKSADIRENSKLMGLQQFPKFLASILEKIANLKSTKDLLNDYEKTSQIYLMDSTKYFIENLPRIIKKDYEPSNQDIVRSRSKTSGIYDSYINLENDTKIHVYDVGGQRSERKKWIHCFNNVTIVIFCVSLSEYDQFLMEDKSQNRFNESLILFENIVNSRWFSRTSVVLFLNKVDLFAEKLKKVPLEKYFPDYTGGQDINKAAKYILWRFIQLNRANLNVYPHVTQATDSSNIKLLFSAVKETILQNKLKDSGVI